MILLRFHGPYEEEWTSSSFAGPDEEVAAHNCAVSLERLDYEVLISRDGEDYGPLEEDAG